MKKSRPQKMKQTPIEKFREGVLQSGLKAVTLYLDSKTINRLMETADLLGYPDPKNLVNRSGKLVSGASEVFSDVVTYLAINRDIEKPKGPRSRNALILLREHRIVEYLLSQKPPSKSERLKKLKTHSIEEAAKYMTDYGYFTPDDIETNCIDEKPSPWDADDIEWIRSFENVKSEISKINKETTSQEKDTDDLLVEKPVRKSTNKKKTAKPKS